MVVSLINKQINYHEFKRLESDDKSYAASQYEIELFDIPIIIAIGQEKYTYITDNIIYFPIYLVKNNIPISQIGIYEIESSRLPNVLDSDNDLDISLLMNPLLYKYVTPEYLQKYDTKPTANISPTVDPSKPDTRDEDVTTLVSDNDENADDNDNDYYNDNDYDDDDSEEDDIGAERIIAPTEDIDDLDEEVFQKAKTKHVIARLSEESKEEADAIRRLFKPQSKAAAWIKAFMKNDNYDIINNEGEGDCFFAVIRDAVKQIGYYTTVGALRDRLSIEATEEVFQTYHTLYNEFKQNIKLMTKERVSLFERYTNLKKGFQQSSSSKTTKGKIIEDMKSVTTEHNKYVDDIHIAKLQLKDFSFMKGINSLAEFKALIKTCNFWAETWAVSTMERALSIKIILMSSSNYRKKNYDNVLLCGHLNDEVLQRAGVFKPKYYIIMDYDGGHYQIITYKHRGIFTFGELPYTLKEMIIQTCMEASDGPYLLIPDFMKMKLDLGLGAGSQIEPASFSGGGNAGLYDPNIIFLVVDYDTDTLPGKLNGEIISPEDLLNFGSLVKQNNWRKKLSINEEMPLHIANKNWKTIQHYVQGKKFIKENPGAYGLFSLDSKSVLSEDPRMAERIVQNHGSYQGKQILPVGILPDRDHMTPDGKGKYLDYYTEALDSKAQQDPSFRQALLATKNAKLISRIPNRLPRTETVLMKYRKYLQDKRREQ